MLLTEFKNSDRQEERRKGVRKERKKKREKGKTLDVDLLNLYRENRMFRISRRK